MSKKEMNGMGKVIEDFINSVLNMAGEILAFIAGFIFKTIGLGIKSCWNKNKKIFILIIILMLAASLIIYCASDNKLNTIYPGLIFLIILFIVGIGSRLSSVSKKKNVDQKNIFEKINFKDRLGNYPTIIKKQKYKNDKKEREMLVIKSMIPYSEWNSKKEHLEQLFNSKIGLRKTNQKQIIKLYLRGGN